MTEEINMLLKDIGKNLSLIPQTSGVYFIVCQNEFKPDFIPIGTDGYFNDKDPNVSIEVLEENWIPGTDILYIGKARDLKNRIKQFIRFGKGKRSPHQGGRYIWQIRDAEKRLQIRWEINESPRTLEKELINEFEQKYGKLPFANLIR